MATLINDVIEKSLVTMVNNELTDSGVYLEKYQRVDMYIYDQTILKSILKNCKFKNYGNIYDYPEFLPQPEMIGAFDLTANFELFQRIAISKKLNTILFYSVDKYTIRCTFLVDIDSLKKFAKKTGEILKHDSGANIFRDTDFNCKTKEYIELAYPTDDNTKSVDVLKKDIPEENLVFDETSTINEVMNDINTFFKPETKTLYKKLEIQYKRGIILFGNPGNGKSAMIREIIRTIPKVSKVIINPNVNNVTGMLLALTKALTDKNAIIVIEDIDSLITERNRSEFLNILDGVSMMSGIYFIGTTNYPERIDPAFTNRAGRFNRMYKIDDPTESTREIFFKSRNVDKLFKDYPTYKDDTKDDNKKGIISLFVKFSDKLPMASLKEIITTTSYKLATCDNLSLEEALCDSYTILTTDREKHIAAHTAYLKTQNVQKGFSNNNYDDDED